MSYGVFDPTGMVHTNDAQLFDGRNIPGGGEVVSQVMVPALGHFGMTIWVESSLTGTLKVEESKVVDANPNDGYLDADFAQYETSIAVTGGVPKKQDYSSTFRPLRIRFTPGSAGAYTLLINARSKGR
jgi:hypothetical protein